MHRSKNESQTYERRTVSPQQTAETFETTTLNVTSFQHLAGLYLTP